MTPELSPEIMALLCVCILLIAALYASVGHGGASGYLALLSLFAFSPDEMASTALILNIFVAGLALGNYVRAGHFSWPLTWPFLVTSIPAAFLGGLMPVSSEVYHGLLAVVLILAAVRLVCFNPPRDDVGNYQPPTLMKSLPVGGGIGLVSGMIGIGGGIFLSPVMILMHWADAKRVSATSALFIVVNAAVGLLGRGIRGGIEVPPMLPFLVAGIAGSLLGSFLGANRFSGQTLRRVLGLVLLSASVKMIFQLF